MAARILVVEDHAANLELVRYLFASAGHEVFLATDGAQGLAAAHREGPDLIAELKRSPDCRDIPVLALTAFSMPGDHENVMRVGFHSYLAKPIEPQLFVSQVEDLLEAARSGDAPSAD